MCCKLSLKSNFLGEKCKKKFFVLVQCWKSVKQEENTKKKKWLPRAGFEPGLPGQNLAWVCTNSFIFSGQWRKLKNMLFKHLDPFRYVPNWIFWAKNFHLSTCCDVTGWATSHLYSLIYREKTSKIHQKYIYEPICIILVANERYWMIQ